VPKERADQKKVTQIIVGIDSARGGRSLKPANLWTAGFSDQMSILRLKEEERGTGVTKGDEHGD